VIGEFVTVNCGGMLSPTLVTVPPLPVAFMVIVDPVLVIVVPVPAWNVTKFSWVMLWLPGVPEAARSQLFIVVPQVKVFVAVLYCSMLFGALHVGRILVSHMFVPLPIINASSTLALRPVPPLVIGRVPVTSAVPKFTADQVGAAAPVDLRKPADPANLDQVLVAEPKRMSPVVTVV